MLRAALLPAIVVALVVSAGKPAAAETPASSAVEAVRSAMMTTCYMLVGGGDRQAAERSVASGDLKRGAPEGFPQDILQSLMTTPDGHEAAAFHVPSSEGMVLVVASPQSELCSVALVGANGEAAGADVDYWFNGPPSPFNKIEDAAQPDSLRRVYQGGEAASRPTLIMTTTMRDGQQTDMPLRFLATVFRDTN